MRLRTKLFLNIGALFFIVIVVSYVMENYMTKKSLNASEKKLIQQIEQANEKKRLEIEKYLSDVLAKEAAKINALLSRINNFVPMKRVFKSQKLEYSQNIWLECATLLSSNKWIDMIQSQRNGKLSALMAVDTDPLKSVHIVKLDDGLTLAIPFSDEKNHRPMIAIPVTMSDFLADVPPIKNPEKNLSRFYGLFSQDDLAKIDPDHIKFKSLNLSINPIEPYIHWIETEAPTSSIVQFKEDLKKAKLALKKDPALLQRSYQYLIAPESEEKQRKEEIELQKFISRYDQIGMIWGLSILVSSGPFEYDPFSDLAPVGFARQQAGQKQASVLYNDQVFDKQPFTSLQESSGSDHFEHTLAAFLSKKEEELFFGNTLSIKGKEGVSDLTVGINGGNILKDLSLSTHKVSAFISKDHLVSAYSQDGQKMSTSLFDKHDIRRMLSSRSGEIDLEGAHYYFIHMTPLEGLDFHFFTLTPMEEEFGLVRSLTSDAKDLISQVSMQMRLSALIALVIVLLVLSQIARRVTKPISVLAQATHFVKEGNLDKVNIPELKRISKRNEVDVLYQSFSEMVKGLKEKERVRGVLNKVVSQEIADAILKGDTHLGGEERDVTVFFADIRGFTSLTEKMSPQEVITLLNECMTKVSTVVDKYGGVIDKYVGDEVMALFGAPISKPESCLHAIKCAVEVQAVLKQWNNERVSANLPKIEMGIGIHKGNMVVGNMGAENRLNYTVLGSNVNLGSRLCSLAKPTEIYLSKQVFDDAEVNKVIEAEPLENIDIKGFTDKLSIYKLQSLKGDQR